MAVLAIKNHENPWRFPARPEMRQNSSKAHRMADRTGTGDVEAVTVSDPELAFESINVRLLMR
jgi:hypothetical protein